MFVFFHFCIICDKPESNCTYFLISHVISLLCVDNFLLLLSMHQYMNAIVHFVLNIQFFLGSFVDTHISGPMYV